MRWRRLRIRLGIKRFLPTSLFGRSLLIFILPVAMMQVAVTWAFFEEHWETVTSRLSDSVAGDVAMVAELHQRYGAAEFPAVSAMAFDTMGLSVDFRPGEDLPVSRRRDDIRAAITRAARLTASGVWVRWCTLCNQAKVSG